VRKWVRLAARLYPASWRRRYGPEFDALIEDASPGWRDVFDVLCGAMMMQTSMRTFRNVTAACGLTGLVIAAGWAYSLPNLYVSSATLRVTPSQIPENLAPATYNRQMAERVNQMVQTAFSRSSLASIIQRPDLDLYKNDRAHKPLEDVIEQMKKTDIRIEIMGTKPETKPFSAFVVSFRNPDPAVAQKTTSALIARLADANAKPATGIMNASLDLLDPANLPKEPASKSQWKIALAGLALGLLAGILASAFGRWLHSPV
jgi:uncharacterized protein involved in exopolysaccharide biosynthesis